MWLKSTFCCQKKGFHIVSTDIKRTTMAHYHSGSLWINGRPSDPVDDPMSMDFPPGTLLAKSSSPSINISCNGAQAFLGGAPDITKSYSLMGFWTKTWLVLALVYGIALATNLIQLFGDGQLIPAIPAIEIMLITTGDGFVKAAWLLISGDPQMIGSILSLGIPPGCGTEKCCVFFPTKNKYLEHLVMGNCLQSVSFAYSFLALKQMPCMLKNSHMFAGFIQISIVKRIPSLTSENSWKLSFFHVMFHHLTVQSPFVWWLNYVKFWFFRVKHHFSFAVFNRFQPSVVS